MLVLHPSSCCDVCLDPYTGETADRTPHAIPCGHIFCKTCLESVTPTICPLCRKPFLPIRAKKLHVDRPENVEGQQEINLLQRLMLAWDWPARELTDVITAIDDWLEPRDENEALPLRKARDSIGKYMRLQSRKDSDRETIRTLTGTVQDYERTMEYEMENWRAIEESLLMQIEELNLYGIAQHESEANRRRTRNPLPAPPEFFPYPSGLYAQPEWAEKQPRDRKGKGKERERDAERRDIYGIYHYPHTPNGSINQSNGIIPGATPKQRFVPSKDVRTEEPWIHGEFSSPDIDRRVTDRYDFSSPIIHAPVAGSSSHHQQPLDRLNSLLTDVPNYSHQNTARDRRETRGLGRVHDERSRERPVAPSTTSNGGQVFSSTGRSIAYSPDSPPRGLGLLDMPATHSTREASHEIPNTRRANPRQSSLPVHRLPSAPAQERAQPTNTRPAPISSLFEIQPNEDAAASRDSGMSWGTVSTNAALAARNSTGNLSDLGLRTFSQLDLVHHDQRSSVASDLSELLPHPLPLSRSDINEDDTPRGSLNELEPSPSPDQILSIEGRPEVRMITYPDSPQQPRHTHATSHTNGYEPRANGAHHHHHHHHHAPSLGNSLGLEVPLQINAPRPIVSSRAFLRSWSYDSFQVSS